MSSKKGAAPVTAPSGEHPAVKALRAKFDSIDGATLPLAKRLNARIDRARKRASDKPARDPRREPDEDERKDEEIPVDVVDVQARRDKP